jgi:hypothetical protein
MVSKAKQERKGKEVTRVQWDFPAPWDFVESQDVQERWA